jgi:hypothetical protein
VTIDAHKFALQELVRAVEEMRALQREWLTGKRNREGLKRATERVDAMLLEFKRKRLT